MYRNSPIRTVTHTSNSTSLALYLETSFKGHVNQNPCNKTFNKASKVVVSASKYAKGQIPSTIYDSKHNNRFLQDRLRRSFRGSENISGDMVKGRIQTTHKYFGIGCCSSNNDSFSTVFRKQECSGQVRQHHCSLIHKQTGRDNTSQTMLSKLGSTAFGNRTQYQNKGCIYSRQEKFSGRSIIQSENSSIRMDPERFNSSVIVQHLGSTNDRSLCISRQSQDTNFLHLVSSQKRL